MMTLNLAEEFYKYIFKYKGAMCDLLKVSVIIIFFWVNLRATL